MFDNIQNMIEYLNNNFSEFVLITTKFYIKYGSNTFAYNCKVSCTIFVMY